MCEQQHLEKRTLLLLLLQKDAEIHYQVSGGWLDKLSTANSNNMRSRFAFVRATASNSSYDPAIGPFVANKSYKSVAWLSDTIVSLLADILERAGTALATSVQREAHRLRAIAARPGGPSPDVVQRSGAAIPLPQRPTASPSFAPVGSRPSNVSVLARTLVVLG